MVEGFSIWLLIHTGREGEGISNDLTSQMFDSIHGWLEGVARIPISERLRPLGDTPSTATIGAGFHRDADASFAISMTNMEPAALCKASENSGGKSP